MLRRTFIFLLVLFSIFYTAVPSFSMTKEERNFLLLYFKPDELKVISATRSLKSISRIAENVEVVTADDIKLMNAHSVAEALQHVIGVEIQPIGGPRAFAYADIQSSQYQHVAVFMDGVPLNLFSDNIADIAAIPVQQIARIEVIKGPASSVWGSSIGGVINIITKAGDAHKKGGTLYGSAGGRTFLDLRAELYGKKDKTGYYFFAGRQQADGFNGLPANSGYAFNDYYLKLSQDLSDKADAVLTVFYNRGARGEGNPGMDFLDNKVVENFFTTLSVNAELSRSVRLEVSSRYEFRDWKYHSITPSSGDIYDYHARDYAYGFSSKVIWSLEDQNIVLGTDYDKGSVRITDTYSEPSRDRVRRWAVYANDTISLGRFSVTPGLRFDNDRLIGDFVSPSLGVTYDLFEKTLLRAYIGRGFNSPPVPWEGDNVAYGYKGNPDLKPEKVWSYQLGIETGVLKYLWLKADLFRHDVTDAVVYVDIDDPPFTYTSVNRDKQRRQGVEVQFKTVPFYDITVSGGATYTKTKNPTTGETIRDYPTTTYDFGIKYDDNRCWKALLSGNYIWWNSSGGGNYNAMIVDANVMRKIYRQDKRSAELFLSVHNIFDGVQYPGIYYRNPGRWIEAGTRFEF